MADREELLKLMEKPERCEAHPELRKVKPSC